MGEVQLLLPTMSIIYHESTQTFHLTNGKISYLMKVFPDGTLGQLYFGKAVRDSPPLTKSADRAMALSRAKRV